MAELKHHMTCRINNELDARKATSAAKELAGMIGFNSSDQNQLATVVSELARNILNHAVTGIIELKHLELGINRGMTVIADDDGPGIDDVEQAFEENFSTKGTLGVGLPCVKRVMDEVSVDTSAEHGTRIIATKWL